MLNLLRHPAVNKLADFTEKVFIVIRLGRKLSELSIPSNQQSVIMAQNMRGTQGGKMGDKRFRALAP